MLTNTLFAAVVVCRTEPGSATIEWTCHRTDDGACAATCDQHDDDADQPLAPCHDTSVTDEHQFTKSAARALADLPMLATPVIVALPDSLAGWDAGAAPPACRAPARPARPPDRAAHLRSIVLRV